VHLDPYEAKVALFSRRGVDPEESAKLTEVLPQRPTRTRDCLYPVLFRESTPSPCNAQLARHFHPPQPLRRLRPCSHDVRQYRHVHQPRLPRRAADASCPLDQVQLSDSRKRPPNARTHSATTLPSVSRMRRTISHRHPRRNQCRPFHGVRGSVDDSGIVRGAEWESQDRDRHVFLFDPSRGA
jgi:hypothetical protein